MAFLLDTNICSYAMRNQYGVPHVMASKSPAEIFISAITLAEAWTGARKSPRRAAIEAQWAYFLYPFRQRVLPFDEIAADRYADTRSHLESHGSMIGDRDCMIAAVALAHGLVVVTRNRSEFERVPGLVVQDWSAP